MPRSQPKPNRPKETFNIFTIDTIAAIQSLHLLLPGFTEKKEKTGLQPTGRDTFGKRLRIYQGLLHDIHDKWCLLKKTFTIIRHDSQVFMIGFMKLTEVPELQL